MPKRDDKEKIGDWNKDRLSKFVDNAIARGTQLPSSYTGEELRSTSKLVIEDDIELSPQAISKLKVYLGLP